MTRTRGRAGNRKAGLSAVLALAFAAGCGPVAAAAPPEPWKGRTVALYIGFGPGGTYDLYARLLARHMGRHIPGNPQIVAQAMIGAGSILLANYLYNIAPKDGTALGIVAGGVAIEEAMHTPGVSYKAAQFNWLGRASSVTEMLIGWHGAKAQTIADVRKFETPTAGTGPASPSEGVPRLLNATIGTRFKIISGYTSSSLGLLAIEKGETDVAQSSYSTLQATKPEWLAQKLVNLLVQCTFERVVPEVPTMVELAQTAEDRTLLRFYTSAAEVGRSFVAPPGIQPDRVVMLRRAFAETMEDALYRAEVEKAKGELNWLPGEKLQQLIAETVNVAPETASRLNAILGPRK